jgi:hypothetical protein
VFEVGFILWVALSWLIKVEIGVVLRHYCNKGDSIHSMIVWINQYPVGTIFPIHIISASWVLSLSFELSIQLQLQLYSHVDLDAHIKFH